MIEKLAYMSIVHVEEWRVEQERCRLKFSLALPVSIQVHHIPTRYNAFT